MLPFSRKHEFEEFERAYSADLSSHVKTMLFYTIKALHQTPQQCCTSGQWLSERKAATVREFGFAQVM